MKWTVVIPVKGVPAAKSRLSPAVPDDARAVLARAFALDTIAAALGARSVGRVIVVGADASLAGGAEFLLEPEGDARGLLPAIRHGIAHARALRVEEGAERPSRALRVEQGAERPSRTLRVEEGAERPSRNPGGRGSRDAAAQLLGPQGQDAAVAVLLGDLPALRPEDLDAALRAASRHPLAFVRDADGTGTTLATARGGEPFEPRFGPDSAAQHAAAGFVELEASATPGLTRDVDTVDALEAVLHHGVGDHTAEAIAHLADLKGTS
ncbi:2-phospho-L-lactate guanylyltransferase [Agromyces sp. Marseille-P2726]|uniref:2-phospho-L-lactate guanylyltransferase n=1 Tax=Agromyces sp. Marseille-P2726 TaxID=2709132 RepID=UPI00156ECF2B|nr:2-phospho-L-lactate guanylyltransferase [Agromyces sp. Marseille-P2726]